VEGVLGGISAICGVIAQSPAPNARSPKLESRGGIQQESAQGRPEVATASPAPAEGRSGRWSDLTLLEESPRAASPADPGTTDRSNGKEKTMDIDLNDDMNKLVRYSIICVDRNHEVVLESLRETLLHERMDERGFTAWKVVEFSNRMAAGHVQAPVEWITKPPQGVVIDSGKLKALGPDQNKFLRVSFQVVDRFPRERFWYEEKQITALEQIAQSMK
jgi:hypothetical protein